MMPGYTEANSKSESSTARCTPSEGVIWSVLNLCVSENIHQIHPEKLGSLLRGSQSAGDSWLFALEAL